MAQPSRYFPVGRADRSRAHSSGNPGPALVQALRQADRVTGASQYASGAKWSVTHPVDRLMGRGRAANQSMEVPWVAGRPWFHGSSRAFEKYDPARADPDSMYGPGHYVTDDPAIASEYAGKGAGHMTGTQTVERAAPLSRDPAWAAFIDKYKDVSKGAVNKLATGHRLKERVARARADYDRQGYNTENVRRDAGGRGVIFDFADKEYGPNVTRYSFEPDEVFDVQAPASSAVASRLVRAIEGLPDWPEHGVVNWRQAAGREVQGLATPPNALNAFWHALENRLGATRANEVIRRAGYDAIHYPGGKATGGRSHQALVVLNDALLRRGGIPNPKYAGVPRPVHRGGD